MIVVDSSAVIAILFEEPEHQALETILERFPIKLNHSPGGPKSFDTRRR